MRAIIHSPSVAADRLARTIIDTPIGPLGLAASPVGLRAVDFDATPSRVPPSSSPSSVDPAAKRILNQAADELDRYFRGTLTHFSVPLDAGGTDFQQRVWTRLVQIPFATTTTYGAIATSLGDPKATRAVGLANGRNPIPIIVPCHRVIGADGSLTGFGGGIPRKEWLLDHERRTAGAPRRTDSLLFSAPLP